MIRAVIIVGYLAVGFGISAYEFRDMPGPAESRVGPILVGAAIWPAFPAKRVYAQWVEAQ